MLTDTNYLDDVCWPVEEATPTAAFYCSFILINLIFVCVLLWQQHRENKTLRKTNLRLELENDTLQCKYVWMNVRLDGVIYQVNELKNWVENYEQLMAEAEVNCVLEEQGHSLSEEESLIDGENALSDNDNDEQEESDS